MRERRVMIEYRGRDKPALIWAGTRATEQWLGDDVLDRMGVKTTTMFWAERIDGIWMIGEACDPEPGGKAALLRQIRSDGKIATKRGPAPVHQAGARR